MFEHIEETNRTMYTFYMYALYYYSRVLAFFRELVWRILSAPMPLYVYKVLKYSPAVKEKEIDPEFVESHTVLDMTSTYIQGNQLIVPTDHDDRIEYRISWKQDKKYRLVSTLSHPIHPAHHLFAGSQGMSTNAKIIHAILVNPNGDMENVLPRVLKYAGPRHDFFNQPVQMRWLFENDDISPCARLHIMTNKSRLSVFAPNDVIRSFE